MQKSASFCLAAILLAVFSAAGIAQTAPPAAAGAAAPAAAREPGLYMTFQTDMGNIACMLFEKEAPITVRTMVGLAIGKIAYIDPTTKKQMKKKFFDGLTFHRVIPGFMIQGGDPLGTGLGGPLGPGFPFKNEAAPGVDFDVPGKLGMANSGPNTNASQFFITEVPYPAPHGAYTVWGQCDDAGVEVVKKIARVKTVRDAPSTPVRMLHVTVERVGPAPANAPEAMPPAAPAKPKVTTPAAAPKPVAPATTAKPPAKPATK